MCWVIWLTNRAFWVTNRDFLTINRVSLVISLMFSIFSIFSGFSMFSHLGWQDGTTCRALTIGMMVRMMRAMMFVKKTTDVSIPRGSRQHQQSARIIISSNIGPVLLLWSYYILLSNIINIVNKSHIYLISSAVRRYYNHIIQYRPILYSVYPLKNSLSQKQKVFALSLSFRIQF